MNSGPPPSLHLFKLSTKGPTRRLLGRKFPDPTLQQEINLLPYNVVEKDSRPYIQVQINGTEEIYHPEEITAEILKRMKSTAEGWTLNAVTHAVITVPTYFTDAQRQATKDAGTIAGLNVLRLLDEPRAAGMAYKLDEIARPERAETVWRERISQDLHDNAQLNVGNMVHCPGRDDEYCYLVFNLEERGCDITIMSVDRGVYELLGNMSSDFGSQDFDLDLFVYLFKQAQDIADFDISEDIEGIQRLNFDVKEAQATLLKFPSALIDLWSYDGEKGFSTRVTREKLHELHYKAFTLDRVLALVKQVLTDTKLEKSAIDGLIVTGDPVYTIEIQNVLQEYFEGAKLYSDIRSDEVVVRGAVSLASVLTGDYGSCDSYSIMEVLSLSLGVETAGGFYTKVIPRYSVIPTRKTQRLLTVIDNQEKVILKIYEGERPMVKHNRFLGSLELGGISQKNRAEVEIDIAFEVYDEFGLTVIAKEEGSEKEARIVFDDRVLLNQRRLEVDEVVMEAEKFYEADLQEKDKAITENRWKEDDGSGVVVNPGEFCEECG
jgi:heat shock protein 5